jgi:hypothetical protein
VSRSCDDGFLTVQFVLAVGLSLALLATIANLLVQRYAVAAVHAALDEGVRAGGRSGAGERECSEAARAALHGLLGGRYGDSLEVRCQRDGKRVEAEGTGTLEGWAPLVPDLPLVIRASGPAHDPWRRP